MPSPIFSQKKPNHKKPPKELRTDHHHSDHLPTRLISPLRHDYDDDYDSLVPDSSNTASNIDEHDGYLRPEQNLYEPLKKTSDLETYRNYSTFNGDRRRQTAAPYEVPTGRVLWTDGTQLGRYADRYQQNVDMDDHRDQFVGPYIDKTRQTTLRSTIDLTEQHDTEDTEPIRLNEDSNQTNKISTKLDLTSPTDQLNDVNEPTDLLTDLTDPTNDFHDTDARTANKDSIQSILDSDSDSETAHELPKLPRFDQDTPSTTTTNPLKRKRRPTRTKRPTTPTHGTNDRRQPGIALVPFVLLTSIERPDNWVMFNVAKSKKRNPLPEVPQLKSDVFSLSELPKPIAEED